MIDSLFNFTAEKLKNGIQIELLWTNPSPSSSFASQTLTISGTYDYDFLMFTYKPLYNEESTMVSIKQSSKIGGYLPLVYNAAIGYRYFSQHANGTIYFADGKLKKHSASTMSTDNTVCIPYTIHGIKIN